MCSLIILVLTDIHPLHQILTHVFYQSQQICNGYFQWCIFLQCLIMTGLLGAHSSQITLYGHECRQEKVAQSRGMPSELSSLVPCMQQAGPIPGPYDTHRIGPLGPMISSILAQNIECIHIDCQWILLLYMTTEVLVPQTQRRCLKEGRHQVVHASRLCHCW